MKTLIAAALLVPGLLEASTEIKTLIHVSATERFKDATTCALTRTQTHEIKRSGNIYKATLDKLFEVSNSALIPFFQKVLVQEGTARIYFSKEAYALLHGSTCAQEQTQAPIEATLKAFSEVKTVEYFIDGKLVEGWDA